MDISAAHTESVAGWRVAIVIVALVLNVALIIGVLSDDLDQVLVVAAVSALPAALLGLRARPAVFRPLATAIGLFYLLIAVAFVYPIGYVPSGVGLLLAGILKRRSSGPLRMV